VGPLIGVVLQPVLGSFSLLGAGLSAFLLLGTRQPTLLTVAAVLLVDICSDTLWSLAYLQLCD
jgi:hypothetical protein